eukprot:gene30056-37211_t
MLEIAEEKGKMFQYYWFGYHFIMINDKFIAKHVLEGVHGKGFFHDTSDSEEEQDEDSQSENEEEEEEEMDEEEEYKVHFTNSRDRDHVTSPVAINQLEFAKKVRVSAPSPIVFSSKQSTKSTTAASSGRPVGRPPKNPPHQLSSEMVASVPTSKSKAAVQNVTSSPKTSKKSVKKEKVFQSLPVFTMGSSGKSSSSFTPPALSRSSTPVASHGPQDRHSTTSFSPIERHPLTPSVTGDDHCHSPQAQ